MRRVSLAVFLIVFCASSAWPKWKPEEQAYLDTQFHTLQDQIQALKKQNDALAAALAQLRQDQAEFQAVIVRQQRKIEDLQQLVASLRIGEEENFSSVKTAIGKLGDQQQKSFNDLIGHSTQTASAPAAPAAPAVKGYVTVVKGDTLTLDVGSSQGLHVGSRLLLFKATDLNTPVGEVEVTEVMDANSSHARVVSLNPGVKAEFSDIVRPE
jgi:hypothetical protein